jgi:HSP20 family protein
MKLIPWKSNEFSRPAVLLDDFDRDFDSLVQNFFGPSRGGALANADWAPMLDVKEGKDEITVKADLPGLKKEEIQVNVDNGVLTISGERKHEEKSEDEGWHRVERSYGSFRRSVRLPQDVESSKVKAEYKDGVLSVTLAKSEASKPKAIKVD